MIIQVTSSLFPDILGLEACLEQQKNALEEQERAQSEAVAATVLNGRIVWKLCDVFPRVDEDGAGRDVKDGAA